MGKLLVLVDGSVQSRLALDRAVEIAAALVPSEIVLLNVQPEPPSWQTYRLPRGKREETSLRILRQAQQRADIAGISTQPVVAVGNVPETVARIARDHDCDQIFLPQGVSGRGVKALLALTGLSAQYDTNKIILLANVPVTVFANGGPGS